MGLCSEQASQRSLSATPVLSSRLADQCRTCDRLRNHVLVYMLFLCVAVRGYSPPGRWHYYSVCYYHQLEPRHHRASPAAATRMTVPLNARSRHVLFCSLAVLDPRVGHTMDVLTPFISVLCHSD